MSLGRDKRRRSRCDDLFDDGPSSVQDHVDDTNGEIETTLLPSGYGPPPKHGDKCDFDCSADLLAQRLEIETALPNDIVASADSNRSFGDVFCDFFESPGQAEVPTPRFIFAGNDLPADNPAHLEKQASSGDVNLKTGSQSLTEIFDTLIDDRDTASSTLSHSDRTRWPTEMRALAGYRDDEVFEKSESPFPKLSILKRRSDPQESEDLHEVNVLPEDMQTVARDAALRRAEIAHEESVAWAAALRRNIENEPGGDYAVSPRPHTEFNNAEERKWTRINDELQSTSQLEAILFRDRDPTSAVEEADWDDRSIFADWNDNSICTKLDQDGMHPHTEKNEWSDPFCVDYGHGLGQMPDSLRRRLEQRAADLRVAKVDRQHAYNGKTGDEQLSSPKKQPCEQEHLNSPSYGPRACSSPQQHKLPPLDPNYPRGIHRCKSQPPIEPSVGSPVPVRLSRHQSLSPKGIAGDDESGGRQMFDKNTLRMLHRDIFMCGIQQIRNTMQNARVTYDNSNQNETTKAVKVYARKRPIFSKEANTRKDYDVLTVRPAVPCPKQITLHNCLFQADLKTPFINHHTFDFDYVFSEDFDNAQVYLLSARALVQSACRGGMGTMFMFGQTGSGKTHTMTAIEEFAVRDLFASSQKVSNPVGIQFIELRGDRCFDLLTPAENPVSARRGKVALNEIRLREQKNGYYVAEGQNVLAPETPEELCTIMRTAHARRATSSTDANDVSSRSHAVCTLRLAHSRGQLLLIDCAGTERRKDSMYHSKERQAEGAEINASLHALKECIRYLNTKKHVPPHAFRASALTKVLAEAFSQGLESQLSVMCTASPCASDSDHTLTTLRTGVSLCISGREHEERQLLSQLIQEQMQQTPRVQHPKVWTPDQVKSWIITVAEGKFRHIANALPSNFTGQMLVRLTAIRCVQLCGGNQRKGQELFNLLHEEMRRVR